jgi:hypothetical protein
VLIVVVAFQTNSTPQIRALLEHEYDKEVSALFGKENVQDL